MVFLTAVVSSKVRKLATRSTILSFLVVVSAVFHLRVGAKVRTPSTVEYALRESTCFNRLVRAGTRVFCISSFPIEVMRLTTHNILRAERFHLCVSRRSCEKFSVACNIRLTKVVPWLENTIQHQTLLNKFLAFAGAYEPFSRPMQSRRIICSFARSLAFFTLWKKHLMTRL